MAVQHTWKIIKISSEYDDYGNKTDSIIYRIETTDSDNPAYLMQQTHVQIVACDPFNLTLNECIEQVKLLVDVHELEAFGATNINDLIVPIVEVI